MPACMHPLRFSILCKVAPSRRRVWFVSVCVSVRMQRTLSTIQFHQAKAQPFVLLSYMLRRTFSVSSASDPRSFLSISSASGHRRLSFVLTVEFRSVQVEFLHGCFILDSIQNESFLIIVNNRSSGQLACSIPILGEILSSNSLRCKGYPFLMHFPI
jgi:hypothetical protein